MNDKFLNLLGMARRAGKLSLGHDAAKGSIFEGRAKLCILTADTSQRLKDEFVNRIELSGADIPLIISNYTMYDTAGAVGSKAGVITADDKGFAERLIQLYYEEHKED